MLTFEYQIHKDICNPHLENYPSVVFPKGCLSLKFGFVKQLATSIQLRTNQLNYGFTNKRKKRTYPNKTITQIIICLIGIILRDVFLREYLHFAIPINFKMQPNYNFFYLLHYFSCELLPWPNLCYFYTYEISVSSFKFPFNLVCPLFFINL